MQNSSPSEPDVPRLDVRSGKKVSPTLHWRSTQVARTLASSLVARAGDRGRRRAIGARRRRLRTHGLSRSRLKRFASKPIGPRQRLFAALARRSPQERGDFFSQALRWRPPAPLVDRASRCVPSGDASGLSDRRSTHVFNPSIATPRARPNPKNPFTNPRFKGHAGPKNLINLRRLGDEGRRGGRVVLPVGRASWRACSSGPGGGCGTR